LNIIYKSSEVEIKEKIDNFFRIFFFFFSELLQARLDYFNILLESDRFFDILLQSYFPQEDSSDLNRSLNEKIRTFVDEIHKRQKENVLKFPNVYKFLRILKDNCNLFMQKIEHWKQNKVFSIDY